MRQDPKGLNYQELYDKLRQTRSDLYFIDQLVVRQIEKGIEKENKALLKSLNSTRNYLNEARHFLRETVEIMDTSGSYPDPPTDRPSQISPLSSGLEDISLKIEALEKSTRKLTRATAEWNLEGWATMYHEKAVMSLTLAKHEIKHILADEESTPREKDGVQSGSNSLQSTDSGFQASGRSGQH